MIQLREKVFKKVFSLGMTALITIAPVFTYADTLQRPDDWATPDLYKAEVSGILPLDWQATLHNVITSAQLKYIVAGLEKKFEQVGLEKETTYNIKLGTTRKDILDIYYGVLGQYGNQLELKSSMEDYMITNKIVAGDTKGNLNASKPCTVQEATLFANRVLENVYAQIDEGAKGYIWEVKHQDNTVYLMGTVHVAQETVYPFNERVQDIIERSDKVAFEVDFNDQRGYAYLLQKQMYMDGTTLKDHISPELYKETIDMMKKFGIAEADAMKYKPWALSNAIVSLSANNPDQTEVKPEAIALPIIDSYIYTTSLLQNKDIIELEGYVFQANMFDGVSLESQVSSLESSIATAKGEPVEVQETILNTETEAVEEAEISEEEVSGDTTMDVVQYWVEAFKDGDIEGFIKSYPKDQMIASGDEMTKLLFVERDKHMTEQVESYLNAKGDDTYFVVVGAAHMIGDTGIVKQLQRKGYRVNVLK